MNPLLAQFGMAGDVAPLEWLLCDIALKGAALLGTGLLIVSCLQRHSAAVRHMALTGVMATLVLLPMLSATLPGWRVLPDWTARSSTPVAESGDHLPQPVASAQPLPATETQGAPIALDGRPVAEQVNTVAQPAKISSTMSLSHWILSLWVIGVALMVGRFLLSQIVLRSLARKCTQLEDRTMISTADNLRELLGIREPVRILVTNRRAMPISA